MTSHMQTNTAVKSGVVYMGTDYDVTAPTAAVRRSGVLAQYQQQDDNIQADPQYSLTRSIFNSSKYRALERAEEDIKAYCKRADGEESHKCWSTLQRLEEEHCAATAGLDDPARAADAAETLERLESLARQLGSVGSTRLMVDALSHLHHKQAAAKGRAARPQGGELTGGHAAGELDSVAAEQRSTRLRQLFAEMDKDGDGVLDIAEFRAAMDALHEHLDGPMVSEICEAMDIHGCISFDQFSDIVEAEGLRSRSPEAQRLRAMLHSSSDGHFADWLSSWQGL